jgi:hypothetical protein
MRFRKSSLMVSTGVNGLAEQWGKVVARRVEEQVGPDLDLDAEEIEQVAKSAACTVARVTIEELLEKKAAGLGPEQPCPECGRICPVKREPRTIVFWGAVVEYREPKRHCPACRRDLFPSTHGAAPEFPWL